MPTSPFTRFMAWIIVLGHAFVLFTPYDGVFEDLGDTWVLLFVLWIVLAISVVRDTPCRDDLAFHRTLPPGAGFAFWSTAKVPLAMLAGTTLVLLVYTWRFHFAAGSFARGLALLTLPGVGVIAACAVAASMASDRSVGKIRGWLTVCAPVVVSWIVLWLATRSLAPAVEKFSLLRLTAVVVVVAAVCYPLLWWRVAVGGSLRRTALAVVVLGAGLPWLYGSYWPANVGNPLDAWKRDFKEESILARRAVAFPGVPGHMDSDVMEARDLKTGELASFLISAGRRFDLQNPILDSTSMITPRRVVTTGLPSVTDGWHFRAGKFPDGSTAMGSDAVLAALMARLPGDIHLESWDASADHQHADLLPPLAPGQAADDGQPSARQEWGEVDSHDWFVLGSVTTLPAPLVFDLAKGGGAPSGKNHGLIRVAPLERDGDSFVLKVERFSDEGWFMDGPLNPVEQNSPGSAPYLVVVDEAERKAYLLNGTGEPAYSRVFLGCRQRIRFETGPLAKAPGGRLERARRLARLPGCKLYVFWPYEVRWFSGRMAAPDR